MRKPLTAVALVLVLAGFGPWGQESEGNRNYRRGEYQRAAARYREAIEKQGTTPRLEYNLGTALLGAGELGEARERLEAALGARAPELRARAFYNLGNALVGGAEAPTPKALEAAIEAYRRTLLLDPRNEDARWNLELAMRRLQQRMQQPPPLSAPGEEGTAPDRQGPGEPSEAPRGEGADPAPGPGQAGESTRELTEIGGESTPFPRELADQILRAVEERERGLQREKLRRSRRRVRGPDW